MINITELAASEIKKIIEESEDKLDETYLRVGIKGGGCSGFSYILDLTDNLNDSDEVFDQHGIKIVCDEKSLLYLNGTTVDFKDEIMQRGFTFDNPNHSTCGCGSSFNV